MQELAIKLHQVGEVLFTVYADRLEAEMQELAIKLHQVGELLFTV